MQLTINPKGINILVQALNHVASTMPVIRWNTLDTLGTKLVAVEREVLRERRFSGELSEVTRYRIDNNARLLIVGPAEGLLDDKRKLGAVWKGAKPRWVPLEDLRPWLRRRGIPPNKLYAVRHSIAKLGTSQYQVGRHGSPDWPFPEETLRTSEARNALQIAANSIGRKLMIGIK